MPSLTPADHTRLASLADLEVLTPDDAKFIRQCIPSNSWLDGSQLYWWYPIGNDGFAVPEGIRREHRISKAHTPRPANPQSLEQQQPWIAEGISRVTWYQRRAAATKHTQLLETVPTWVQKEEGLKLYAACARFAHAHGLEIKGLWDEVCKVLGKVG